MGQLEQGLNLRPPVQARCIELRSTSEKGAAQGKANYPNLDSRHKPLPDPRKISSQAGRHLSRKPTPTPKFGRHWQSQEVETRYAHRVRCALAGPRQRDRANRSNPLIIVNPELSKRAEAQQKNSK